MATYDNAAIIQFPMPSAAWTEPTHFGLWDAMTAGNFRGGDALSASVSAPAIGADVQFAAGALDIEIPDGDFTTAAAGDAIEGFVGTALYVSLHSADPGDTGASELTGGDYARVEVLAAGWT